MTQNGISWIILGVTAVALVAIVAMPKHVDENGNIKNGKKPAEEEKEKPATTTTAAVTNV